MNNRPQVLFTDQDDAARQMESIQAIERIRERHANRLYSSDRIFPPTNTIRSSISFWVRITCACTLFWLGVLFLIRDREIIEFYRELHQDQE